jgi:putative cell wall-binding protein
MSTCRPLRAVLASLVAAVAVLPLAPSVAAAASPVTTLHLLPATPDGSNGWWRTPPLASAVVDQDAVLHFDWGTGESTAAVTAGSALSLGVAPEGQTNLHAYGVGGGGDTGTVATAIARTDSVPPARPVPIAAVGLDGAVTLSWPDAPDDTSGISSYTVFRNLSGPPFAVEDAVAAVDGTTWVDHPGPAGAWFYGVRATDRAGNDSLMSDAVRVSADIVPPTPPSDLQAWLNGRGFARVSWAASVDRGSGVACYEIDRAFPGQPMSVMATVAASASFWDDGDTEAAAADGITYQVTAFDRAGNRSGIAGPVDRGTDLQAPSTFDVPEVRAVQDPWGGTHSFLADFEAWWSNSQDFGSGVARYELDYGPDPAAPSRAAFFPAASFPLAIVESKAESADWWFSVRAEDRAGNVSEPSAPVEQRAATAGRIGDTDRILTSIAVSRATFTSATSAVFVSARNFPDGLAASSLAGALHAPVLLVDAGTLRAEMVAELERLGVRDGYVVGGPPAVSSATYDSIAAALPGATTRISGTDRYLTAAAVASAVGTITGSAPDRVFVVSGQAFADALSVGPASYASASPILFATPGSIPSATTAALAAAGGADVTIVGGPAAVTAGADRLLGGSVRVAGADRYETSADFAEWAVSSGILGAARPVLVTGVVFADGLSSAPFAGSLSSPVLLTRAQSLPVAPAAFLRAHAAGVRHITAVGGEPALDNAVLGAAWSAIPIP